MSHLSKIKCNDCGKMVTNLSVHRFLTKKQGNPCLARPKKESVDSLLPVIQQAIKFTSKTNYANNCLRSFNWWLEEDAFDTDFKGFDHSYSSVTRMCSELLEQLPDYHCDNKDCRLCS